MMNKSDNNLCPKELIFQWGETDKGKPGKYSLCSIVTSDKREIEGEDREQ